MAVPISQMWTVAAYVLKKKLAGNKRYPLVLMLEPLFRCKDVYKRQRQCRLRG